MAISITWGTKVIYVPQNYLTDLGGGVYELDVDEFRLDLKDLEDSEYGMPSPDTHVHETESTLSGVIYARKVTILSPYTVEFEDGQYTVSCVGANHNIADVKVVNQVSLIIGNAAGLIVSESGVSGLTPAESDALLEIQDFEGGRWHIVGTQMIFYEEDNVTEVARFNLLDSNGDPTGDPAAARQRVRV
jgi:hypothetical protein